MSEEYIVYQEIDRKYSHLRILGKYSDYTDSDKIEEAIGDTANWFVVNLNDAEYDKLERMCRQCTDENFQTKTKKLWIPMKSNIAYWCNDGSIDWLRGYVSGKIEEHFYLEEDKFEAVYELTAPVADAIAYNLEAIKTCEDFDGVELKGETENFKFETYLLPGTNDFDVIVERI